MIRERVYRQGSDWYEVEFTDHDGVSCVVGSMLVKSEMLELCRILDKFGCGSTFVYKLYSEE